ncbi:hypothetical protein [Actinoplanes cyaneus]|uniref:hypothetical protein n=1 Tax=Actinoplanes cyaneus TaxID=52696 RepID=UPI001942AFD0|nr:hypothetical protein [Actinoplanes cyaneus]MCW2143683.1 hypothetical protein [Actinoplanes cyaneus]
MEPVGSEEARLRIARYLESPPQPATPPRPGIQLPDIADYWPDAPHRQRAPGRPGPVPSGPMPHGSGPHGSEPLPMREQPARRWRHRPVVVTGVLALAVIGGSVVLARPLTDADVRRESRPLPVVPAESAQVVIPLEPSPAPSGSPSPVFTTTPVKASPTTAPAPVQGGFELVTGVTDLVVRTADLDGDEFRVSGPGAGTFSGGVLRLSAKPDGGTGPVEVRLSDARVWQLRIGAGTRSVTLDLGGGTVSRIDLDGGAERIDITLGRLTRTVPIRMAGGVSTWRIRTATKIPARVQVGNGAGDVVLYGKHSGGTGAGTTLRSGDLDDAPGLDVTAAGGLGTLEITAN